MADTPNVADPTTPEAVPSPWPEVTGTDAKSGAPTFTLKVDGEERAYTAEQIIAEAQKSAAAGNRFEQGKAELDRREQALKARETFTQIGEDLMLGMNAQVPDREAYRRAFGAVGVPAAEINARLAEAEPPPQTDTTPAQPAKGAAEAPRKITLEDFDPQTRQMLVASDVARHEAARKTAYEYIDKAVDGHGTLGKLIKARPQAREVLVEQVRDAVTRRVKQNPVTEAFPDTVTAALEQIGGQLDDLGVNASESQPPTPPPLGLGGPQGATGASPLHPPTAPALEPGTQTEQELSDALMEGFGQDLAAIEQA